MEPVYRDLAAKMTPTRLRVPYGVSALIGLLLHASFIGLFAWTGVWPLAAFNVLSVVVFAVLFMLVRVNRIPLGVALAMTELAVHQALAVHYVGLEPGFQYFLLAVGPIPLLMPDSSRAVRFGLPIALLIEFLALTAIYAGVPAPYALDPLLATALNYVNLLSSFLLLWAFAYFYQYGAEVAEGALDVARKRSEELLHNILPPQIVDRLRAKPGVVADSFEGASILFTDLVGFTPLAQTKSPDEVVRLLDSIVGAFDDLVVERGLEKIKTIGDAYMVAAGVPEARPDHAQAIAELALAMRERFEAIAAAHDVELEMRIGIHSGPVVAGVIGKSKFAYDLWGDTVNTAARMESHGEPGKIQLTKETVDALGDGWLVEERGHIEVKGKGAMKTYWLVGPA